MGYKEIDIKKRGQGKELSRRSFLKGAGVAGVASAAMLAGCTSAGDANATADVPTTDSAITWDRETDVLVIGCGGGGLTSAISAQAGGAEVLIIEKATVERDNGYGCSTTGGANFAIVTDQAEAVKYLHASNMGATSDEVEQAWAELGTQTLEWLESYDINYVVREGLGPDLPSLPGAAGLQAVQVVDPDDFTVKGGAYFMRIIMAKFKENGGEIILNTRATELLQNSEGAVIGVTATQGGASINIKARKAVVLATGGYEGSKEMLLDYGRVMPMSGCAWPLNTGDGIKMAQAIGADLWHMNNVCSQGYGFVYPGHFLGRNGINGSSWPAGSFVFINKWAERFICENPNRAGGPLGHRTYMDYGFYDQTDAPVNAGFRDCPFYCVFDEKLRMAGPIYAGPTGSLCMLDPADGGLEDVDWSADNTKEIEAGYIIAADTLEELADKINAYNPEDGYALDGAKLAATIAQYNDYCAAGQDLDWDRPAVAADKENLVALDTAPYYAIRLQPTLYSTCGGPRKNAKSQVLDTKGNPIPHLYEAGILGESAGQSYTVYGQNWAEIFNFGRSAGANAAAETALA